MTKQEILTQVICAHLSNPTRGSIPRIDPVTGKFENPVWVSIVEAICKTYPEKRKQPAEMCKPEIF